MGQKFDPTHHFAHRANDDGTVDSICKHCFATLISTIWEAELEKAERAHVCDPAELERFKQPHREAELV